MTQQPVFIDEIWSNPEICNNCFSRIRQVTELEPADEVSKHAPTEDRRRTASAVQGYAVDDHDRYGKQYTWRSATFCRNCGSESGLAGNKIVGDKTLKKGEAVECIIAIAHRLEEMGYDVDLASMRQLVKRGKSREQVRNHDRELLARATEVGLQARAD